MDKLFDFNNIYKKFFLRDVLSIFTPGLLFLLAMIMINGDQIKNITKIIKCNHILRNILVNNNNELSIFSYLLLIGVSYALGLIINWFRDYVQFRWFYNKQNKKSTYRENVEDFWKKLEEIIYKDPTDIADYFERMVVMFQVTGNLALTIILCLISLLIWNLSLCKLTIIVPVVFVIALIYFCLSFSFFKFDEHITYLKNKVKKSNNASAK